MDEQCAMTARPSGRLADCLALRSADARAAFFLEHGFVVIQVRFQTVRTGHTAQTVQSSSNRSNRVKPVQSVQTNQNRALKHVARTRHRVSQPAAAAAGLGLGRIVALRYRSSTLYQIH
jgi:hypothetical protein